ncbi:RNA polymerase sigma factor SigI7 [bioreactor metagenome]|uniref:RNA polymerase sigma factor SigI7 n=1 Tax=bioreactor metagenome TaxID=1076179 RepID=A0A644YLT4_9ZZZZ
MHQNGASAHPHNEYEDGTVMQKTDEEALCAARDRQAAEDFIAQNRQFILRCASKCTRRYVTCSDDAWSVALMAFSEAISLYQADKGPFLPFAELVIRRRLTDFLRSEGRHYEELSVAPSVFEGQIDDESPDIALQESVIAKTAVSEDSPVKYEIEAIGAILSSYGFSFIDLTSCSPKTAKTKKSCAAGIKCLRDAPALLAEMRNSKTLPVKTICERAGIDRKILERHRKYIIAAAEILCGDFPALSEYLKCLPLS